MLKKIIGSVCIVLLLIVGLVTMTNKKDTVKSNNTTAKISVENVQKNPSIQAALTRYKTAAEFEDKLQHSLGNENNTNTDGTMTLKNPTDSSYLMADTVKGGDGGWLVSASENEAQDVQIKDTSGKVLDTIYKKNGATYAQIRAALLARDENKTEQ
jgi:hypothetical protein